MSEEVNYKIKFMDKYYKSKYCDFDIDKVDIIVKNSKNKSLLYIESKNYIFNDTDKRKALAQIILTNKKQQQPLTKVAVIYKDKKNNDILIEIDCSDDSILHNNDINWKQETPSNPTKDAIDRINDRIKDHIKTFKNEEIKEYFKALVEGESTEINITKNNFITIYKEWKNEIKFNEDIKNEQDFINLFIVDILNGTKYEEEEKDKLFSTGLTISGTRIDSYKIFTDLTNKEILFLYKGKTTSGWTVSNMDKYNDFWRKYKRPPQRDEFIQILELHSKLYSDKYRRTTGSEYTPYSFVELQNKKLKLFYNMDDFIVFDPCCGVGNLQNDFGKDYKNNCYMSTLEQMDVDVCKTKGFENVEKFDFLKDDTFPTFKYKGDYKNINEICEAENKKLMIIMNPPYQKVKGHKDNLAIEFFNKCLKLKPQVIVFYYRLNSFLNEEFNIYNNSKYKIISLVFSNAKTTFKLSEWPICMAIFDKDQGKELDKNNIDAERYEVDKESDKLVYIKNYCYNNRPYLINEINNKIKENAFGTKLGNWNMLQDVIALCNNREKQKTNFITVNNLKYCLLSKGLNFNTHDNYFERNDYVYKGTLEEIPIDLYSDSICFSLFYKNMFFTNKGNYKNYIMPFSANELGCNKNDLNVLFPENNGDLFNLDIEEKPFDFREFLKDFTFSQEAKDLFNSALKIFKYYHKNNEYTNKDWNDSFYDIRNAIMGKDESDLKTFETENDTRIIKNRTTKGTKGFGRNTIKYAVSSEYLPIFMDFFNKRDILAKKINKQLVDNGLLLWERENIY